MTVSVKQNPDTASQYRQSSSHACNAHKRTDGCATCDVCSCSGRITRYCEVTAKTAQRCYFSVGHHAPTTNQRDSLQAKVPSQSAASQRPGVWRCSSTGGKRCVEAVHSCPLGSEVVAMLRAPD